MADELKNNEISAKELENAAGGNDGYSAAFSYGRMYTTHVNEGYLALRSGASASNSNILAPLNNGSNVIVVGSRSGDYVYVRVNYAAPGAYSGASAGMEGFVNVNYLIPC